MATAEPLICSGVENPSIVLTNEEKEEAYQLILIGKPLPNEDIPSNLGYSGVFIRFDPEDPILYARAYRGRVELWGQSGVGAHVSDAGLEAFILNCLKRGIPSLVGALP